MTEFVVGMKVFSSRDNRTGVIVSMAGEHPTVRTSTGGGSRGQRSKDSLIPLTPASYFKNNRESALAESLSAGDIAILNTSNAIHGNGDVPQWEQGRFEEIYWSEDFKCWKAHVNFPSYGSYWHGLLQELVITSNVQTKHVLENM